MEFDLFKWIIGGLITIAGWIIKMLWNKVDKLEENASERTAILASVETKLDMVTSNLSNHMAHEETTVEHLKENIQDIKVAIAVLTEQLKKKD